MFAPRIQATDATTRDVGVVALTKRAGEIAANLHEGRHQGKAARNLRLSLGFLDETEVADIPPEAKKNPRTGTDI